MNHEGSMKGSDQPAGPSPAKQGKAIRRDPLPHLAALAIVLIGIAYLLSECFDYRRTRRAVEEARQRASRPRRNRSSNGPIPPATPSIEAGGQGQEYPAGDRRRESPESVDRAGKDR